MTTERFDAGTMGCGRFAFELHRRMKELPPGGRLEVTSHDPGTVTDLPAWCRMTGYRLVSAEPPVFVIEKSGN